MGERPPFLEGGNLALVIFLTLLTLGGGLLWIGPEGKRLEEARAELAEGWSEARRGTRSTPRPLRSRRRSASAGTRASSDCATTALPSRVIPS
jgi:hypothetical protein